MGANTYVAAVRVIRVPYAAISDIFGTGLIPKLFFNAVSGKMTPEVALIQADQEVRKIYDK
jgi:hypothetical protein